jgi:hypothetical protein
MIFFYFPITQQEASGKNSSSSFPWTRELPRLPRAPQSSGLHTSFELAADDEKITPDHCPPKTLCLFWQRAFCITLLFLDCRASRVL